MKRMKWNFLAENRPTRFNKGRSLLSNLKIEQTSLLEQQEKDSGKRTPARLPGSNDQTSTKANTSLSKKLESTSVKSSNRKTRSTKNSNVFTTSCKNDEDFYN